MHIVRIQVSNGLLLIGSPVAFHPVMRRANDALGLRAAVRMMATDRMAMRTLRKGWRGLVPSQSAAALDDAGMARQLGEELAANRLKAILLREPESGLSPQDLGDLTSQIVHVEGRGRTVLIARRAAMPTMFRRYIDAEGATAALENLQRDVELERRVEWQAPALSDRFQAFNLRERVGVAIARGIARGELEAAVLTDHATISMAAARPDAPDSVEWMSPAQRVGMAMIVSQRYLDDELRPVIEGFVSPENLAMMATLFMVAAAAQSNPVSAAAFDSALVTIAWLQAGTTGIRALAVLFRAVSEAMQSVSDREIDKAAQRLAKAFTAVGGAILGAFQARGASGKRGTQAKEPNWKNKLSENKPDFSKPIKPEKPPRLTRPRAAGGTPPQPVTPITPGKPEKPPRPTRQRASGGTPPTPVPPVRPDPESAAAAIARSMIERAREAEPALTEDIAGLTKAAGGTMQGMKYRLKTADSLADKIARDMKNGGLTAEEAASRIVDTNRYTATFPDDKMVSGYNEIMQGLKDRGYKTIKVKNTWNDPTIAYNGINIQLVSPTGQPVELQVHTEKSFWVKDKGTHALYEKQRGCEKGSPLWQELEVQQRKMFDDTPRPPGIETILPYPPPKAGV